MDVQGTKELSKAFDANGELDSIDITVASDSDDPVSDSGHQFNPRPRSSMFENSSNLIINGGNFIQSNATQQSNEGMGSRSSIVSG